MLSKETVFALLYSAIVRIWPIDRDIVCLYILFIILSELICIRLLNDFWAFGNILFKIVLII